MNENQILGKMTSEVAGNRKGPIQAAIFDLDGVLMNSEWLAFQIWKEIVEAYGGKLDKGAFPGMVGLTAEETAEFCMQYTGLSFDVTESCQRAWRRVMEVLGTKIDPMPGAAELVNELTRRGYPLAIASNSPIHYIENALTGLGMCSHFPVRVGIDQVALGKPAPDVYLEAASRLGVAPENCLAVEDSRVGVQAAAAAGMRVLAVPSPHDHHDNFAGAWWILASLQEVVDDLEVVLGEE